MKMNSGMQGLLVSALICGVVTKAAAEEKRALVSSEKNGRIEAKLGDELIFGWQREPLANPAGGEKFKGSAFLHPLRTPAGFEWTSIQPKDHLHHFGLWWPWKFIEVDGAKYNCWEIQEGQGGMVAKGVKQISQSPDKLEWEFENETLVKKSDASVLTAIQQNARIALSMDGNAQVLDITLMDKAAGSPVTISAYRYSGFSWRGPAAWNKDNSTMTTSEGKDRDNANSTLARWVMVSGTTPQGSASVLMMSAASELAGTPEKLRVWDSKTEKGTPFINFNPVMGKALPLDDAHPAVSHRKYRIIAADRVIDAAAAEAEWKKWMGK